MSSSFTNEPHTPQETISQVPSRHSPISSCDETLYDKASLAWTSKSELRIRHFISRGNGILVPVIALDELPLELHGVPGHLLWEDTRDMVFLGELQSSGKTYAISEIKEGAFETSGDSVIGGREFVPTTPRVKMPEKMETFQMAWRNACAVAAAATEAESGEQPDNDEDLDELSRALLADEDPESVAVSAEKSASSKPLPPSGIEPDESRKEYCSYWIRTGECAYTQQGCKYKHEMPPDRATLKRVFGIDQWPSWWIERFPDDGRVLAMFPSPHRLTRPFGAKSRFDLGRDYMMAKSWRTEGPTRPAVNPAAAYASLAAAARDQAQPTQQQRGRRTTPSPPQRQGQNKTEKADDPVTSSMASILDDPFLSSLPNPAAPSIASTDLIDLESVRDHRSVPLARTHSAASTTTTTSTIGHSLPRPPRFHRHFDDRLEEARKSQKQPHEPSSISSSKTSSKSTSPVRQRYERVSNDDDDSSVASGSERAENDKKDVAGQVVAVKAGSGGKRTSKSRRIARARNKARELSEAQKVEPSKNTEVSGSATQQDGTVKKEKIAKTEKVKGTDQKPADVKKGKEKVMSQKSSVSASGKAKDAGAKKDVQKENVPPK